MGTFSCAFYHPIYLFHYVGLCRLVFNTSTDGNVQSRADSIKSGIPNAIFHQAQLVFGGPQSVFQDPNGFWVLPNGFMCVVHRLFLDDIALDVRLGAPIDPTPRPSGKVELLYTTEPNCQCRTHTTYLTPLRRVCHLSSTFVCSSSHLKKWPPLVQIGRRAYSRHDLCGTCLRGLRPPLLALPRTARHLPRTLPRLYWIGRGTDGAFRLWRVVAAIR